MFNDMSKTANKLFALALGLLLLGGFLLTFSTEVAGFVFISAVVADLAGILVVVLKSLGLIKE